MASPFFSTRSSIRICFSRMPSSAPPPFKFPHQFIYVRDLHQLQNFSKSNYEQFRILRGITYMVKYLMCHPRVIMGQVLELLVHAVHFDVQVVYEAEAVLEEFDLLQSTSKQLNVRHGRLQAFLDGQTARQQRAHRTGDTVSCGNRTRIAARKANNARRASVCTGARSGNSKR